MNSPKVEICANEMRIVNVIKLTSVIVLILGAINVSAKTLKCDMDGKYDSLGWLPESFVIKIDDDRERIIVQSPVTSNFGEKPFKKAAFGSNYWSSGSGKQRSGGDISYQLQLSLKQNDSRYRLELTLPSYLPILVQGRCLPANSSGYASGQKNGNDALTSKQCRTLLQNNNPQLTIYAALQVRAITPEQVDQALSISSSMEYCINMDRGAYPPIREFISSGDFNKPLRRTECSNLMDRHAADLASVEVLLDSDPEFKKKWQDSSERQVFEWCHDMLE